MSLGAYQIKPILLFLGILSFILLSIPLLVVYCYIYIKSSLVIYIDKIKKEHKDNKNKGLSGV